MYNVYTYVLIFEAPDHRRESNSSITVHSLPAAATSTGDGRWEGGSSQLQQGQLAAAPSVEDDGRRELLNFSEIEIVTEISEQLILPLSMGLTNFAVSY